MRFKQANGISLLNNSLQSHLDRTTSETHLRIPLSTMDAVTQSQNLSVAHTGIEQLQNDNAHPTGGSITQGKKEPTLGWKTHETGSGATIEGAREVRTR